MQGSVMNIRLNSLLIKETDKIAKQLGLSRSEFVRLSLKFTIGRIEKVKLVYDVVNDKFRAPKG